MLCLARPCLTVLVTSLVTLIRGDMCEAYNHYNGSTMNLTLNLWRLNVQRLVGEEAVPCKTRHITEDDTFKGYILIHGNHYNGKHSQMQCKTSFAQLKKGSQKTFSCI